MNLGILNRMKMAKFVFYKNRMKDLRQAMLRMKINCTVLRIRWTDKERRVVFKLKILAEQCC